MHARRSHDRHGERSVADIRPETGSNRQLLWLRVRGQLRPARPRESQSDSHVPARVPRRFPPDSHVLYSAEGHLEMFKLISVNAGPRDHGASGPGRSSVDLTIGVWIFVGPPGSSQICWSANCGIENAGLTILAG